MIIERKSSVNKKGGKSRRTPVCYVIAGPNGGGKTTFAMEFLPRVAGCRNFINADLIARGLSPLNVENAAIEAGRLFICQIKAQVTAKRDFAFESTLAGTSYVRQLQNMRAQGYAIRLYYLWIPSVSLTLRRIAERVRRGGHNIPDDVARRRYGKGLRNLFSFYLSLADYAAIFDNSSAEPLLVYEREDSIERVIQPKTYSRIRRQAGEAV